jgi:hypothetical protein
VNDYRHSNIPVFIALGVTVVAIIWFLAIWTDTKKSIAMRLWHTGWWAMGYAGALIVVYVTAHN